MNHHGYLYTGHNRQGAASSAPLPASFVFSAIKGQEPAAAPYPRPRYAALREVIIAMRMPFPCGRHPSPTCMYCYRLLVAPNSCQHHGISLCISAALQSKYAPAIHAGRMRLYSIIPRRVISLRVLPVSYRSCASPTTDVPVVSVYIDMKSPHSYIALQVLPVQSFD